MKKYNSISPVLMELILAIFFFILIMCVVIQLMSASASRSIESYGHSEAFVAVTDVTERIKSDPSEQQIDEKVNGVQVTGSVTGRETERGVLYIIEVKSEGENSVVFKTSQYVRGED